MAFAAARRGVKRTRAMMVAAPAAPAPAAVGRASLLRLAGYRWLLLAHLVSQLGDGLYSVALPWMVWQHTHSGIQTTATLAIGASAYLVVGPAAGVYVDRWNRRTTLIGADVLRAAILIVLTPLLIAHFSLVLALIAAFTVTALGRFFFPAQRAAVPSLVPEDSLVSANGTILGVGNAAYIAGPALGGVLIATVRAPALLALDGLTFAASALLISLIAFPRQATAQRPSGFAGQLAEGFRVSWRIPALRASALVAMFATVCFTPVPALLPLWAGSASRSSASLFGFLTASFFVGSLAGGIAVARIGNHLSRRAMIVGGLVAMGIAIVAFGRSREAAPALLALALLGFFLTVYNVGVMTLLQERSPAASLGRVFAVNEAFSWSLRPLATLGAGIAADSAGVHSTVTALGAAMLALGIGAVALKSFRQAEGVPMTQEVAG